MIYEMGNNNTWKCLPWNSMQCKIFRKLVRNKQHMALNTFLSANNEYFYHVMWSKIESNTVISHYFIWKYWLETYAYFWIKAVCKIGNIYSEILCPSAAVVLIIGVYGQGKFRGRQRLFCPNVCSQQFRLSIPLPEFKQGGLGECFPAGKILKFSQLKCPFLRSQSHIYYKIQLWRTQISPWPTNCPINTLVEIAWKTSACVDIGGGGSCPPCSPAYGLIITKVLGSTWSKYTNCYFTPKMPFSAFSITYLLQNSIVKNTNFTLIYKLPKIETPF